MSRQDNYPDPVRKNLLIRTLVQEGAGANAFKMAQGILSKLDSYDLNKYITTNERLWNPEYAEETGFFVIQRMLQAAVDRMLEMCDRLHLGKPCDCALLTTAVMGLKEAPKPEDMPKNPEIDLTPKVDSEPAKPHLQIVQSILDEKGNRIV